MPTVALVLRNGWSLPGFRSERKFPILPGHPNAVAQQFSNSKTIRGCQSLIHYEPTVWLLLGQCVGEVHITAVIWVSGSLLLKEGHGSWWLAGVMVAFPLGSTNLCLFSQLLGLLSSRWTVFIYMSLYSSVKQYKIDIVQWRACGSRCLSLSRLDEPLNEVGSAPRPTPFSEQQEQLGTRNGNKGLCASISPHKNTSL